jgi:hypothetical protein
VTPRHVDALFVLLVCTLLAEMLFQLPGAYALVLVPVFGLLSFVASRGFRFNRQAWVFLIPAGLYVITAIASGLEYNVVLADLRSIGVGCLLVVFGGLGQLDVQRRSNVMRWLLRGFVALGLLAGFGGMAKLILLNQGVVLELFTTPSGTPFAGSSLSGDYNVYAIGLMLCLVAAVAVTRRDASSWARYAAHLAIPGMIAAALMTSSRRTVVFIAAGALVLALARIWSRRVRRRVPARPALKRWVIGCCYLTAGLIAAAHVDQVRTAIGDFLGADEVRSVTSRYESIGSSSLLDARETRFHDAVARIEGANLPGLLIGTGFTYVDEMGATEGLAEDYPHNFLLSAMLYGGLLQAGLSVLMLLLACRAAWRSGPDAGVLCAWLAYMVAFHMGSSNSIFSMKLLTVVILISLDLAERRPVALAVRTPQAVPCLGLTPADGRTGR